MTRRPTPRLATGLIAGLATLSFAPAANAGIAYVAPVNPLDPGAGSVLFIAEDDPSTTNAAGQSQPGTQRTENNNFSVERIADIGGQQRIVVRDIDTAPSVRPGTNIPDPLKGGPLDLGAGCTSVDDPKANQRAATCIATRFVEIRVDAGDLADSFFEAQTDTESLELPKSTALGGAGDDALIGTKNADVLDGGDGSDQLYGFDGDDTLRPGKGQNDPIAGDAGIDTVDYGIDFPSDLTVILDDLANDGPEKADNITGGVENITTGKGNDTVIMFNPLTGVDPGAPNRVTTGDGNDNIKTGGGDDSVSAGEGNNTVDTASGNDNGSAGAGDDTITLGTGNDTFDTGAGTNSATGGDGTDSITGGGGADTFTGGAGTDTLSMGAGKNDASGNEDNDTITAGGDDDTLRGDGGDDTITDSGGTNTLLGGPDKDKITGGAGVDTVDGGDGDDSVNAGAGNDTVNGGGGNDNVAMTVGTTTTTGLFGGAGDDTISGDDGNDRLDGGDGNDDLQGGAGADNNIGGNGTDRHSYAEKTQSVFASLANLQYAENGTSSPAKSGTSCPGEGCEGDDFATVEDLLGGSASDELIGTDTANTLEGNGGSDNLRGLLGADRLVGGKLVDHKAQPGVSAPDFDADGYDQVSYRERTASVTVILDGQPGDGQSGENDNVFGDIERVEGGQGSDRLVGSNGRNDLLGLAGNDSLEGEFGPDLLDGGEGTDTVSYGNRADGVKVTTDGVANDGNANDGTGDNVLGNVENIFGSKGNDELFTTGVVGSGPVAVNNVIDGDAGDDVLDGFLGSDELRGGEGEDTVRYSGRPSTEVVQVTLDGLENDGTYDPIARTSIENDHLFGDVENLVGGDEIDRFIGRSGKAAKFSGGGGDDFMQSRDGKDVLDGGAGNDELRAGANNDTLTGGPGCDILDGQSENDVITDPEDCDQKFSIERAPGEPEPAPATASAPASEPAPAQQTTEQPAQESTTTQETTTQESTTTTGTSTADSGTAGSTQTGSTRQAPASGTTVTRTVPVTSVEGTVASKTLKSIKVTRSGARAIARVKGIVADRSCKRGQTVLVKVLAGKRVVGTRTAKLRKGCAFSVAVPVRTAAKTVTATVALQSTGKTLRAR